MLTAKYNFLVNQYSLFTVHITKTQDRWKEQYNIYLIYFVSSIRSSEDDLVLPPPPTKSQKLHADLTDDQYYFCFSVLALSFTGQNTPDLDTGCVPRNASFSPVHASRHRRQTTNTDTGTDAGKTLVASKLANGNNQHAWLASNTEHSVLLQLQSRLKLWLRQSAPDSLYYSNYMRMPPYVLLSFEED